MSSNDACNSYSPGLLDKNGLLGVARQIGRLRSKLESTYGHKSPSVLQLGAALVACMYQSDDLRLKSQAQRIAVSSPALPSSSTAGMSLLSIIDEVNDNTEVQPPSRKDLIHYISICNAAYVSSEAELKRRVRLLAHDIDAFDIISFSVKSTTYCPAYYLVFNHMTKTLILCVRGSQNLADFITDLNADNVQFLDDRKAHFGMVESARNLHKKLRPILAGELARRNPRGGLVVTGHSLGAGTGSALTLLLRRDNLSTVESKIAQEHLRNTRCYAFSPPPILTRSTPSQMKIDNTGITCVVNGYDMIPRLSLKSVDRLVHKLATLDYSPNVAGFTERTVTYLAEFAVPKHEAQEFGRKASDAAIHIDAVNASRCLRGATAVLGANPNWGLLSNVLHVTSKALGYGVEQHTARVRESNNTISSRSSPENNLFTEREQEENAGDDGKDEMILVGNIIHLERDFSLPDTGDPQKGRQDANGQYYLPRSRMLKRDASFFKDIEVCTWMTYDHFVPNILRQLRGLTS